MDVTLNDHISDWFAFLPNSLISRKAIDIIELLEK